MEFNEVQQRILQSIEEEMREEGLPEEKIRAGVEDCIKSMELHAWMMEEIRNHGPIYTAAVEKIDRLERERPPEYAARCERMEQMIHSSLLERAAREGR